MMIEWMKKWIRWFLLIPDDNHCVSKTAISKSAEKLADFERWAFGGVDSHTWTEWQRERIWNIRHGDVYTIPEGEHFRDHMDKITKLYEEYRRIAGI